MNKCVNCDYTTENDEKFCPVCGGEIVVDAPAAEVVGAEAPGKKSIKNVGITLSAIGLILIIGAILLNLLSNILDPITNAFFNIAIRSLDIPQFLASIITATISLIFLGCNILCIAIALTGLVCAIIGLIRSRKGDKLGKILSIIAIVLAALYAIGLVVGFIIEVVIGFTIVLLPGFLSAFIVFISFFMASLFAA